MTSRKYLFNFSASYLGGGRKRLEEYARWFDRRGGAWFIVHPRSGNLCHEFPANHYLFVQTSAVGRVLRDCAYLGGILHEIGIPDLYYSYGIPIYRRVAQVNWFHVSNVLPFSWKGVPLSRFNRLKFRFLGRRMLGNLCHADLISAESRFSLSLLPAEWADRSVLSVNGSDDELAFLSSGVPAPREETAVVLGTASYKAIGECYEIFKMLRRQASGLRLVIIGHKCDIPSEPKNDPSVISVGLISRKEVIALLGKTKYYISATKIENSYNAAAEGVFLADESYISDIGPHRELLEGEPFERLSPPEGGTPFIHVRRADLTGKNLKSWEMVASEMVAEVERRIGREARG